MQKIKMFALFSGLVVEEHMVDQEGGSGKMGLDVLIVYLYVRRKLLTPPVYVPPIPTPPLEHQFGGGSTEDPHRRPSILEKSELHRRRRQSIQILGLQKKTPVEIEVATSKIDNVFAKYEKAVKARTDAIKRLRALSLWVSRVASAAIVPVLRPKLFKNNPAQLHGRATA